MKRLSLLTLGIALLPSIALAQSTVAVVASKDVHETVIQGLESAGVSHAVFEDDGGAALLSDKKAALKIAVKLSQLGKAKFLVIAKFDCKNVTNKSTASIAEGKVTLRLISGPAQKVVLSLSDELRAKSGTEAKARKKLIKLAKAAFADWTETKLVPALSKKQRLRLTIAVARFSTEVRRTYEKPFRAAIEAAGFKVETVMPYNRDYGLLRFEGSIDAATRDAAEEKLHKALKAKDLTDFFKIARSPAGVLTYLFQNPYRSLRIPILDIDTATQKIVGPKLVEAFAKMEGIEKAERLFKEFTVVKTKGGYWVLTDGSKKTGTIRQGKFQIRVQTRLSPMDIDRLILAHGKDSKVLASLELVNLDDNMSIYRFDSPSRPFKVEFLGIKPSQISKIGVDLDTRMKALKSVAKFERSQNLEQGSITYTVVYQGLRQDFEKDLLELYNKNLDWPRLTSVVPSTGKELAYRIGDELLVVTVEVSQISPTDYKKMGKAFLDAISSLSDVAIVSRKYDPTNAKLSLTLEIPQDVLDLDAQIWEAASKVKGLNRLTAGKTSGQTIGYLLLADTPNEFSLTVTIAGVAPSSFMTEGRQFIAMVRAMKGVSKAVPNYDKTEQELTLSFMSAASPEKFQEDLLTVMKSRDFSQAFAPDKRVGHHIRLTFLEKQGEYSKLFIIVENAQHGYVKDSAAKLLSRVKGFVGVKSVVSVMQGGALRVALWSKQLPAEFHDQLASSLSKTKDIVLTDGQLNGNVITLRADTWLSGAETAQKNPPKSARSLFMECGGSAEGLGALIAKLNPSVATVQASFGLGQVKTASAFFVSGRGVLVTSFQGVSKNGQRSQALSVTLNGGRRYKATWLAGSQESGVALLQIPGKQFPALTLAENAPASVGRFALVLGHSGKLSYSATTGVVTQGAASGVGLTSAVIHSGNEGGPVLDARGQVVGIAIVGGQPKTGSHSFVSIQRALKLMKSTGIKNN
ncbi:MAG: serine protease [Planctomycetota bacterium]|nr:serine protease [Planctomycetota bacterium]